METKPDYPVFQIGSYAFQGLTKREYFAAMAMQGLLANNASISSLTTDMAVTMANYLIAELNKPQ